MKLRCLEAFWILSTVQLSMRPWNPKLKLKKTQIDLTGSTFRKIHSRVVPKKRDPRNLGCSQSPRKKRDPPKEPMREGSQRIPNRAPRPSNQNSRKMMQTFWKCKASHLGTEKNNDANLFSSWKPKTKKPFFGRQDRGWNQEKRKSFCAKKLGNPRESLQLRFKTGICFKLKQFGESKGELWYNCWNSKRDQTFASDNN